MPNTMQLAFDDITQSIDKPLTKHWLKTALISNMESWIASHSRMNKGATIYTRDQITVFVNQAYSNS